MASSLRASNQGLEMVDRARSRQGWTKTRTAEWWQQAHTSQATLRRFWQQQRIQADAFIAICQVVGIEDWEAVAVPFDIEAETVAAIEEPTPAEANQDWSEAPDLMNFYGREAELAQLESWILTDQCKVITIFGQGGVGKTSLALTVAGQVQHQFEVVLWKALRTMPVITDLLDSMIGFLSNETESLAGDNVQQGIAQLLQLLRQKRCLIILDEFEAILQSSAGHMRPQVGAYQQGYDGYGELLTRLWRDRHQSCVILTSREKPKEIGGQTHRIPRQDSGEQRPKAAFEAVGNLKLDGLCPADSQELLKRMGIAGLEPDLTALSHLYSGNPFALKVIVPIIKEFFEGDANQFLQQNTVVLSDPLSAVLEQQIDRLSDLERELVNWLAIEEVPLALVKLQTLLRFPPSQSQLIEALVSLQYRSLLEGVITETGSCFGLHRMIRKVVRTELVEQATNELVNAIRTRDLEALEILNQHLLCSSRETVGGIYATGNTLLNQIKTNLLSRFRPSSQLIAHLSHLRLQIGNRPELDAGYCDRNLAELLGLLRSS